ncbi:MAG: hypothetical protein NTV39_01905 [Candidatus Saccharibacteria bacterium]|nr:hypothetical protein [Candidatus Saccharibacteria bacterium]
MKKFLVAMVLSISILTTLPASAGAAAWLWSNHGSWTPTHTSCASVACPADYWVPNNTKFIMRCYMDAQWATGNYSSNRWFAGYPQYYSRYTYVHSSYVYYQYSVPRC